MREVESLRKLESHNKQLKDLDKGKTKSLGFVEKIMMKYAGWVDGRKGLLRYSNGVWKSSILKEEVDSYQEFCAKQFGRLKIKEEERFKQINTLFDKINPLRKEILITKQALDMASKEKIDYQRKKGEEKISEDQVITRRSREREERLQPLRNKAVTYEAELSETVDNIFKGLSQIKESFDSTVKITDRVSLHSQRKVDVYWRAAMNHMPDLPAVPDVQFINISEQKFAAHYDKLVQRAEKLRRELYEEVRGC